jgi:hypothetical protein
MKVNWLAAATMTIAASLGLTLTASAQSPTYTIADYSQPNAPPMPGPDPEAGVQPIQNGVPPAPMFEGQAPTNGGAQSCPACEAAEEETCDPWRLFCQKECGWNFHGFVNVGYTYNFNNPPSGYNGPVTFNDRDEVYLDQLYLIAEKTIDRESCCWNWGGRVDALYGTDYIFTQSNGWETTITGAPKWNGSPFYGLAVPQLYAEVGNVNNSIKIGHFYTPHGYEVVPATGNFFYSHAYTMQYGEPFTHWGILGNYKYSDELSLLYGVFNGWDALSRVQDDPAGMLGFTYTPDEQNTLAFNFIVGNEPNIAGAFSMRYLHTLVYTRTSCDKKWQYVFQHDYGTQAANAAGAGAAEWYGINQYLFYTINDCWKAGARFEWFRDDDGARVTGLRPDPANPLLGSGFAGNFFDLALGLNWMPTANLTARLEYRYDWFDGIAVAGAAPLPYDDGTRTDQHLIALDAIYLF